MKKILILTVTAGEGHNSIAKALAEYLQQNPENNVKTIDLFKKYSNSFKQLIINEGYMAACKYAMPIYNMIYRNLQKSKPENRNKVGAQATVMNETAKLLQDIYLFEPDAIICTHFYGSIILSNLKKIYEIPAKTISIVTDYSVHPFWEASIGVDYLVTLSDKLHPMLLHKGYKEEQLLDFGMPVRKEFSEDYDKLVAREELGLDKDKFTVLVMFGGGGFGQNVKVFKKLLKVKRDLQIIVVNGKDRQSKKKIDALIKTSKTKHKVVNYGFVNFVSKIMSAADILVGKSGGISVNEALNKHLPMILSVQLAQQEIDNMKYLVKSGAALNYSTKNPVEKVVTDLFDNRIKLDLMKERIEVVRKPNAIKDICNLAESFENASYSTNVALSKKELEKVRKEIKKMLNKKDKKVKTIKTEKIKKEKPIKAKKIS